MAVAVAVVVIDVDVGATAEDVPVSHVAVVALFAVASAEAVSIFAASVAPPAEAAPVATVATGTPTAGKLLLVMAGVTGWASTRFRVSLPRRVIIMMYLFL